MSSSKTEFIGIVCERSVDFSGKLDGQGNLLDDPRVKIIQVPCSGQIQPVMIEAALKKGAKGVFTTGCRIGDCHYREGNKFLKERLMGKRMPKLKPTVDKTKLDAYWLSAVEYPELRDMVAKFTTRCSSCPNAGTEPVATH